ncbi:MAG: type IV pilin [Methanohalobium sp.]|uniref:type IV pilin n=1 Tax=Methanohalobium sp. TaxID=2837493 RepID=UPI00397C92A7
MAKSSQLFRNHEGVTPIVGIILMVAITVITAAVMGAGVFDITSKLKKPPEHLVLDNTEVILGSEFREGNGWNDASESKPDIDHIYIDYVRGPVVEGDEVGSVLIKWDSSDGKGGEVRFINPDHFNENTKEKYDDQTIGKFYTGNLKPGNRIDIILAHNRYETNESNTNYYDVGKKYIYTESYWNEIDIQNRDYPFFGAENRIPREFRGNRPMEPGDKVEVTFLGPDHHFVIAQTSATAKEYNERAEGVQKPGYD